MTHVIEHMFGSCKKYSLSFLHGYLMEEVRLYLRGDASRDQLTSTFAQLEMYEQYIKDRVEAGVSVGRAHIEAQMHFAPATGSTPQVVGGVEQRP